MVNKMLKHKILLFIISIISFLGLTLKVSPLKQIITPKEEVIPEIKRQSNSTEHDLYNEIIDEVTNYVNNGTLQKFHLNYVEEPYYQIPYVKFKDTNLSYWASLSEAEIKTIFTRYYEDSKSFITIMQNLNAPIYQLEKNQAIGFYFDGIFLNFLWTSEYLPIETYNLQSVSINGHYYTQQILTEGCSHMQGDGMFELTSSYAYPKNNIQLNMTPIGGFHHCSIDDSIIQYGLIAQTFEVTGFEANYDSILNGLNPGEEDKKLGVKYKTISFDYKNFAFSKMPEYQKNAMMQLSSHVYIEITDVECQSQFVPNFGGYEHAVFFNTNLNLDDVYRVDVSYSLASDNKPWYNFIAKNDSMDVVKSLTPNTAKGGLFGLSTYQGLSTGKYQSYINQNKQYKYRLFLNYDADGWNFFKGEQDESKYTNVHNFKILRMNFLYKGQEIDCEIKMDEIEGKTLSIFDQETILDTDSKIWEYKEITNNITEISEKSKTTLYIIMGSIGTILLIYVLYKSIKLTKKFISKGD